MILDLALALALLALAAGVALWWASERRRRALGLPPGRAIYQDHAAGREPVLRARTPPLRGRPDLLLRQGDVVIPVEVKTGRTPREPTGGTSSNSWPTACWWCARESANSFLPQAGEVRRNTSRSPASPGRESRWGQEHGGKAGTPEDV